MMKVIKLVTYLSGLHQEHCIHYIPTLPSLPSVCELLYLRPLGLKTTAAKEQINTHTHTQTHMYTHTSHIHTPTSYPQTVAQIWVLKVKYHVNTPAHHTNLQSILCEVCTVCMQMFLLCISHMSFGISGNQCMDQMGGQKGGRLFIDCIKGVRGEWGLGGIYLPAFTGTLWLTGVRALEISGVVLGWGGRELTQDQSKLGPSEEERHTQTHIQHTAHTPMQTSVWCQLSEPWARSMLIALFHRQEILRQSWEHYSFPVLFSYSCRLYILQIDKQINKHRFYKMSDLSE